MTRSLTLFFVIVATFLAVEMPYGFAQTAEEEHANGQRQATVSPSNETLVFNFSGAAWKDVLTWFAEQADLSLQIDRYPVGTVNFADPQRTYTVSEGLDLLNRLLLDRGYALVRRGRMLLLIDLEVENAANLISEIAELVTADQLDSRSRSDIVSCVFPLGSLTPDAAREEIAQLLGPWGRIVVLDSARQVKVTETVGKLLAIRQLLDNAKIAESNVSEILLEHRSSDEMLELARPLLGLDPGMNASDDIRISVGLFGDRIYATGLPGKLALLESIIKKADKPLEGIANGETDTVAAPVFETHAVNLADSATVFDVLQTLLQGTPDARIAIDPKTNAIVALARPETQALIKATIDKLEGSGQEFKVLTLRRLDPAQALLTINKFFGVSEEGIGDGPIVDGDPVTNRLWVRGSKSQIEQVEKLIGELEGDDALGDLDDRVRILPYTGQAAVDALNQVQAIWPELGRNNAIRTIRTGNANESSGLRERRIHPKTESNEELERDNPDDARPVSKDPNDFATGIYKTHDTASMLVQTTKPKPLPSNPSTNRDEPTSVKAGGDIVVQMTPAGMVIASDDAEALNTFEALMESIASPAALQSDLPTMFVLKFVRADVAAELISSILGGGESAIDSMTDSLSGGLGGGMLGLLGVGGGGGGTESSAKSILTSTGSINIVPDSRLNALFVQANPIDLEVIELLLRKIDIQESPEDIDIVGKPNLIPVIYQNAKDIADIVKSVFAEKMEGASDNNSSRGGGQPSPQEFIAALRGGGRGGRGGGSDSAKSEPSKINIAVDERSNSLIVTATPQDFNEVRDLVMALDEGGMQSEESVEVVTLSGNIKAEVVKEALEAVLGQPAQSTSGSDGNSASTSGSSASSSNAASGDEIRRRIEMFRAMRGGDAGGGPGAGLGGGRPGGGFGGGRPGGGGGGGGRPGGGGGRGGR